MVNYPDGALRDSNLLYPEEKDAIKDLIPFFSFFNAIEFQLINIDKRRLFFITSEYLSLRGKNGIGLHFSDFQRE